MQQLGCHFFLNDFNNEIFSMMLSNVPTQGNTVAHQSSAENVVTLYRVKEVRFFINSVESYLNRVNVLLELL